MALKGAQGEKMVKIMPHFVAPIKKEAKFLLRYSRSRPHFKRRLAIDAILSMAVVLAAFQIVTAPSRHNASYILKISGAVAFSGADLVKFVKQEKLVVYWLGNNSAGKYTLIATTPDEVIISYFSKKVDFRRPGASKLIVQTHAHFTPDKAQTYSHEILGSGSFLINQGEGGNAVYYNRTTPDRVTVIFSSQNVAVTIFNPVPQASLELAMKVGVIQKIS